MTETILSCIGVFAIFFGGCCAIVAVCHFVGYNPRGAIGLFIDEHPERDEGHSGTREGATNGR